MPSPLDPYRKAQQASPQSSADRLIQVYDIAIQAAKDRQEAGVRHCLDLLKHGLNPCASPEIVMSLSVLYKDCEALLEKKDFGTVAESLERIRGLWLAKSKIDSLRAH